VIREIFGPALLDEQAIQFFRDAKERLLKSNGIFIPKEARMFGRFIECKELTRTAIVKEVLGFNLSLFNALHDDPTIQANINDHSHKFLSDTFEISERIKFGEDTFISKVKKIQFKEAGLLSGVCQWFELYFGEVTLSASPEAPATHWKQHVQLFENLIQVNAGDSITFEIRQYSDRFSIRPI
jgi:hypothetical protein